MRKLHVRNTPATRRLRRTPTPGEAALWEPLRDRRLLGLKFRRQHAIYAYVLDFYCAEARLAVEVDGGIHKDPVQRYSDRERQQAIEELGIRFVRLDETLVTGDTEAALAQIEAAASPSPAGTGEGAGG